MLQAGLRPALLDTLWPVQVQVGRRGESEAPRNRATLRLWVQVAH